MDQFRHRGRWVALSALLVAGAACGSHGGSSAPTTTAAPAATPTTPTTVSQAVGASSGLTLSFYGPLSGSGQAIAAGIEDGERLAVSQYMADRPAVRVRVVAVDSTGRSAPASLLATDPVAVLDAADPGRTVTAAGIPVLAVLPSDVSLADRADTLSFRVVPDLAAQGLADAGYLAKTLSARSVAVVDDGTAAGTALAGYVALGLDQSGTPQVGDGQVTADDVAAVAGVATPAPPAAVFFGGTPGAAGAALAALRSAGYQGAFLAGDGADPTGFVTAAGTSAAGAYLSCSCDDVQSSSDATTFTTAYQAAYGSLPPPYAAESFDATSFVLAAIAAGDATPGGVAAYLQTKTHSGVTGSLAFQPDGTALHRRVYMYKVKAGAAALVGPIG